MKLLVLFALVIVLAGCDSERQAAEKNAEAWEKSRASMELSNLELDASTFKLTAQLVQLHFGREAADLWVKCKTVPPKAPAHQKACKAIEDKFDKWNKAERAKDASAAAKW